MKTRKDVDELKVNWMGDACWDIEETEGFEEYKEELLQFRLEKEIQWGKEYNEKIKELAKKTLKRMERLYAGSDIHQLCEENISLFAYIGMLEERVAKLEHNALYAGM